MEEYNPMKWRCNRCRKWNRIRKVTQDGEYLKKCSCGRVMKVKVKMRTITIIKKIPIIIGLRDIHRRCDRGQP